LNDLECAIHLKVRLMDVCCDHMHWCSQKGRRWAGGHSLPPCGQLARCFSAVAELLVIN